MTAAVLKSSDEGKDTAAERIEPVTVVNNVFNDINIIGEVYLIPTHEYDDTLASQKCVGFKANQTNIEKYISFFNSINNRPLNGANYEYERCTLLIVDFSKTQPKLYQSSAELKRDGLISQSFDIEYAFLALNTFAQDILNV